MSKSIHLGGQYHASWHSKALPLDSKQVKTMTKGIKIYRTNLNVNNLQKLFILAIFDAQACVVDLQTNFEEVIVKKILNLSDFYFAGV